MNSLLREATRWMNQLDTQEWLFVLIGVVVVGLVCLKGFGSRSQY